MSERLLDYEHPVTKQTIMRMLEDGFMYDKRYFNVSVDGNVVYVTQREIRGETNGTT